MTSIPTVTVYKGSETRNINEGDLATWIKDGWVLNEPKVNLTKMSVEQLRSLAKNIPDADKLTKEQLITILSKK